jgi:ABC-type branched-subunit amino acid transport system substrate-binding protein
MKRSVLAVTVAVGSLAASWLAAAPACAQYSDGGIKIGILTDMSGGYSDLAGKGSVTAAQLAIEDFGRAIGGRKVELIFADHQNKADIASTIARGWFDTEGVDAIFDINSSVAGLAVREVAREKGKIDIITERALQRLPTLPARQRVRTGPGTRTHLQPAPPPHCRTTRRTHGSSSRPTIPSVTILRRRSPVS